jgi:hypothetical protein
MSSSRFESTPAWRIARLRAALRDAMQRGGDPAESGEDLGHRALRRRFAIARAMAAAAPPRQKTTRKGRRFPLSKQVAIWRAILALRPVPWRQGDKAPSGSIAEAHRRASLVCRDLGLAPPRYRTVYVLWHRGLPSAAVRQALSDAAR